ncbi:hypothetical protein EDB86DRAFT_305760 [Lactarius hatsudake]|nr:hypothetical protein EDB86DRAFT_305760 [Lactarius hatsudake]
MALRCSLAYIRAARISPAVLTTPPAEFVPTPQGVGLPSPPVPRGQQLSSDASGDVKGQTRGLHGERVGHDVWHDVLYALTRPRDARRAVATERGMSAAVTSEVGGTKTTFSWARRGEPISMSPWMFLSIRFQTWKLLLVCSHVTIGSPTIQSSPLIPDTVPPLAGRHQEL